jgi:hypothetical protein
MKHKWFTLPRNNVLLPEEWRCHNCDTRNFSVYLLDEESECPETHPGHDWAADEREANHRYALEYMSRLSQKRKNP